jgi:hypothetical protein
LSKGTRAQGTLCDMTLFMKPTGEDELREHYRRASDDDLLAQAVNASGLTDAARQVVADELSRRALTSRDVDTYREYLRNAEMLNPRLTAGTPIANRVNGCGTCLLHERDHRPDGSYVVTKWLCLYRIPVFTLQSLRVRRVGGAYQILEARRPFKRP